MVYGIEFNLELTKELERKGELKRGLLLNWGGSMWVVIGYTSYGWVDELGSCYIDYQIILMHIKSGISGDFPYQRIKSQAEVLDI